MARFWRRIGGWLGFSESSPRPIDQMFLEMAAASGAVSRDEALSVPAVQKGRNMICSISSLPLVQRDATRAVVPSPLLDQLDPDVPNVVHLAQTLEDLLFDGIAWWRIVAFGWDGYPVQVRRLDPLTVSVNPPEGRSPAPLPSGYDPRGGVVWVDGKPVAGSEVIRFDSPNPAVRKVGGRAIRRAILLDKAAAMYAENPRPADYLSPAPDAAEPEDDQIRAVLAQWIAARRRRSTAWLPRWLQYNSVDAPSPADLQLVQLQKQAGLDIANALGVDPEELGISTTSRTYANAVDRRRDRVNDVLAPFMRAITDRLSMGDVTKRGYRVTFVLDDYMKADPITRWTVYEKAKGLGVMNEETIAAAEDIPALPPSERPEPPAAAAEPIGDSVPNPEPAQVDAAQLAAHTFDRPSALTFDAELTEFAVDADARTIEGLALPYGKTASKFGQAFRFERGALRWTDPGRVKLLRDHDSRQAIGRAVSLTDSHAGLKVRFKVARGAAGDEALHLAEDGVLDGMSVGVDFDLSADTVPDPKTKGAVLVRRADLREISLTAVPAFDDARVTKVAASRDQGDETVADETATTEGVPAGPVTLSAEQFSALLAAARPAAAAEPVTEPEPRQVVNPTRLTATTEVREALPYRFDRGGNFANGQPHTFSADLHEMALANDGTGTRTDAGKRVMALLRATFDVDSADINELTPNIQRPDMYVDQREYRTPLWNFVHKGAPPNGIQPFTFPKFNTASGLVGDHTEGTEPASGTFTTTNQTVTPTPISGKASITREVWDMGGNPAVSGLIFRQMVRGWREGLESATATFLNTLTAATDLTITAGAVDDALADSWEGHLADLQFVRGYDFEAFAVEKELYKRFASAEDTTGRRLYPMLGPTNANGTAASRFRTLDLGGVTGVPSWALASTAGSPNNSWLFDPSTVHGWATAPQRLEFPGTDTDGDYAPVAMIDLAIWGYKAFANSDIGGVRQVIYDTTA